MQTHIFLGSSLLSWWLQCVFQQIIILARLLEIYMTSMAVSRVSEPEAVHIIAGDFNHAGVKTELPKFYQHVKCVTGGANTLDKVYSRIKLGFRAKLLPHLDQSGHMTLFLIQAETPSEPITSRTVKTCPWGASHQLLGCFWTLGPRAVHSSCPRIHEVLHGHCHCG